MKTQALQIVILLVAIIIGFVISFAFSHRYTVVRLNDLVVVKVDNWTGKSYVMLPSDASRHFKWEEVKPLKEYLTDPEEIKKLVPVKPEEEENPFMRP